MAPLPDGGSKVSDTAGCCEEKDWKRSWGDTFLMKDLPGGRKGVALSDGMGSGEEAFWNSTMVVEMLEELSGSRISGRDSGADDELGAGNRTGRSEVLYIGCLSV